MRVRASLQLLSLCFPPFKGLWEEEVRRRPHSRVQNRERKSNESHPGWVRQGRGYVVLYQKEPLSSVVFFGEVQGAQAPKAEAAALRVKAVYFSVLALKQVLDPLCALLLQRRQLLFNLSGRGGGGTRRVDMTPDRFLEMNLLALANAMR